MGRPTGGADERTRKNEMGQPMQPFGWRSVGLDKTYIDIFFIHSDNIEIFVRMYNSNVG